MPNTDQTPTSVFAIVTRGLEGIASAEMQAYGLRITRQAYRRVEAHCGDLREALKLRTVDDLFLHLADWPDLTHMRAALDHLTQQSSRLALAPALDAVRQVRSLPMEARFSVTANYVGKRNYSSSEIKTAVARGVARTNLDWIYTHEDAEADLNLRIFIEHDHALVGLRLAKHPLHRRAYKTHHLPGSLKPAVAAAMVMLAADRPHLQLLDPFCGVGTILAEAAALGHTPIGGDLDAAALGYALENAPAPQSMHVVRWHVQRLPIAAASVDGAASNLPWGQQTGIEDDLRSLYAHAFEEIRRVLKPGGQIVLLTLRPDLLPQSPAHDIEISLFGKTPHVVTIQA